MSKYDVKSEQDGSAPRRMKVVLVVVLVPVVETHSRFGREHESEDQNDPAQGKGTP